MVCNNVQFQLLFGSLDTNELNNKSVNPLTLAPADPDNPIPQDELDDYRRMIKRAPMLYRGTIPSRGPAFPNVRDVRSGKVQLVPYSIVRYNSGHVFCFALGFKFVSITQCEEFIQLYNIAATKPRVRSLLQGNQNKLARRVRAHKICAKEALEGYYNARAENFTYATLRRRRRVNKIVIL